MYLVNFDNTYVTKLKFCQFENSGKKVVSDFGSNYTSESFFSKLKLTKYKIRSNITGANVLYQILCANCQTETDLQKNYRTSKINIV